MGGIYYLSIPLNFITLFSKFPKMNTYNLLNILEGKSNIGTHFLLQAWKLLKVTVVLMLIEL